MRGVLEPGCMHAQTTMNRGISCASVQASEPPTLSMPPYKVHVQRKRGTEAAVSWVWDNILDGDVVALKRLEDAVRHSSHCRSICTVNFGF